MPDWLSILKAYVDTLETAVGAIEGATTLHNKLTAARALLLDQITAVRLAELDAANLPADIDTLLTRLSALRAGYLDNLSGGAVALAASWTAALATALGNYTAARAAYLDELAAANLPADIDTLLARLTALRAGYLDELGAANIPADIDTLLGRLTAVRAGYLDNLSAGAVALAATALSTAVWTAARGGYLDELAAANIPADVDTVLVRVATTVAGRLQEAATTIDLNQVAATYSLLTGTTQVVILESLVIQMPVGAAGGALTSISIQTNDATVAVIISSVTGAVANLTSEAQLAWTGAIRIGVGKIIRLTIAGGATGAAYVCNVNAQYRAVVSGGTLA